MHPGSVNLQFGEQSMRLEYLQAQADGTSDVKKVLYFHRLHAPCNFSDQSHKSQALNIIL
jgi:hypothetical protein